MYRCEFLLRVWEAECGDNFLSDCFSSRAKWPFSQICIFVHGAYAACHWFLLMIMCIRWVWKHFPNISPNHLEDAMRQFYRQSSWDEGQDGGKGSEKEEMKLNAFDGICYLWQKKGQKAHFCPTKQNGENASGNGGNNNGGKGQRFTGTCYNCRKQGHWLQKLLGKGREQAQTS